MKIIGTLGILTLFFFVKVSPALAQAKPLSHQQAGDCSVNITGNGNTASLTCKGIDPTLAKQIQEILNSTKQGESAANSMSDKLDRVIKHMEQEAEQPLVGLKIVGPKGPGIACANESNVIARDILWQVVLWNRDTLELQPLPIPEDKCDWLRPHDESAPHDISRWFAQLKPGTHLIGSAMISCPNCITGRTYIVSIVVGESGWFSEVNPGPGEQGRLLVPVNPESEDGRAKFFMGLEASVPATRRIPIADQVLR